MYSSTTELFRILKVRDPSADQTAAAERVLNTATLEIDSELGLPADHDAFTPEQQALIDGVALDRGADLWRHTESVPGVIGVLNDVSPAPQATGYWRYSWERYAERLAPLKGSWGVA